MTKVVPAVYRDSELDIYQGNPLIEALPEVWDRDTVIERIKRFPPHRNIDRNLPPHLRVHMLQRLLEVFVPLPIHLHLEKKVSNMIRAGYRARNPHSPAAIRDMNQRIEAFPVSIEGEDANSDLDPQDLAQGLDLIGVSGMGKSSALRRVLKNYDQVLIHTNYKGRNLTLKQIVWLHIECPSNGSLKAFCTKFFEAVDRLIQTDYQTRFNPKRLNTDTMILNMATIAARQAAGLIVVDEIQNISAAKSGGDDSLINHLVGLRNEIGLPVILVGTPEADTVLSGKFRNGRRGTGWGNLSWDRFKPEQGEWDLLLRGIWRYQYTSSPTPLTPELAAAIFEESQGITDLVTKVYLLAQMQAILEHDEDHNEVLTPERVRRAAREGLGGCQRYLNALRSGNVNVLRTMKDVRVDILPIIATAQAALERKHDLALLQQQSDQQVQSDAIQPIVEWLVDVGISLDDALLNANQAFADLGPDADVSTVKKTALLLATGAANSVPSSKSHSKTAPKKQRKSKDSDDPTLEDIVLQRRAQGTSGYEALFGAGLIKADVV